MNYCWFILTILLILTKNSNSIQKTIGIYGGIGEYIPELYQQARDLGAYCANNTITIYCNGLNTGTLAMVANESLAKAGIVNGNILKEFTRPSHLFNSLVHQSLSSIIYSDSIADHKKYIFDNAHQFILIPTGLGQLTCVFDILYTRQKGYHNKQLFFYGPEKYFKAINELLLIVYGEKIPILSSPEQIPNINIHNLFINQAAMDNFFEDLKNIPKKPIVFNVLNLASLVKISNMYLHIWIDNPSNPGIYLTGSYKLFIDMLKELEQFKFFRKNHYNCFAAYTKENLQLLDCLEFNPKTPLPYEY